MSAARHTPGPWQAKPPRIGAAITIYAGDFPVATTCSNTSPATMQAHRDGTVKANARLLAAAPDMLREAQSAIRRLDWFLDANPEHVDSTLNVIRQDLRAIVAQATGVVA